MLRRSFPNRFQIFWIVFAGLLLALHASSAQAQRSSSWETGIGFLIGKFHIDDAGADKIETARDCQSLCVRQNRCKVWEFESSAKRCKLASSVDVSRLMLGENYFSGSVLPGPARSSTSEKDRAMSGLAMLGKSANELARSKLNGPVLCRSECLADPKCGAWSHISSSTDTEKSAKSVSKGKRILSADEWRQLVEAGNTCVLFTSVSPNGSPPNFRLEKWKDVTTGIVQIQPAAQVAATPPATPAPAAIPAPVASAPPSPAVAIATPGPVPASLPPPSAAADPGRRVALVIGNSAYRAVPALPNPQRDADAVAAALRRTGFKSVTLADDLTREKLIDALRVFAAEAEKADWAVVYFAGHGIEIGGVNYLIPIDAKLAVDRDVQFEAVPLEQVMGAADGAKKFRLVLLDACRDNPFAGQMRRSIATRSIGRGLAQVEPDSGTLVVYAAKHGQTAMDGEGANSPFVSSFIKRLATPGLEIRKLFDLVRDDVMKETNRRQQPYSYGSVPGSEDFFFVANK